MFAGFLICFGLFCVRIRGEIFPSLITTNASMVIVVDREYLAENYDRIRTGIEEYLVFGKREILKHTGVNVLVSSWPRINVKRDLSIILSITSCEETWDLFNAAESEHLLHVAISEQDCARLPQRSAITIPIIERGQETPQLLLDLRTTGVYTWKNMVIIYDGSICIEPNDLLIRVIKSITKRVSNVGASGISMISLEAKAFANSSSVEDILSRTFSQLIWRKLSKNFIVVAKFELVEKIMQYAKQQNLVDTNTQWLYVISDSNDTIRNMMRFKTMLREGDNVAFIYNNTSTKDICVGGIECHINESLAAILHSLDRAYVEESEISRQYSDEEWEAIRPSKLDRKTFLLSQVQKYLFEHGNCDNCTKWNFASGETWGKEYQTHEDFSTVDIIPVGSWRPSDGPTMIDALFPHVAHGFRRSNLPLVSFHNPPWQILKTNASGDVVEFKGIVFDIIQELAKNLNFTYTVEVVQSQRLVSNNVTSKDGNKTDDDFLGILEKSSVSTFRVPQAILDIVHNKSAIMGACAFTVTEQNKKIVNFTDAISIQPYTTLAARPRELSRALLFISPFGGDTWLCLSLTILSMGPILFYIHKYSPVYEYKGISKKGGLTTVQNCIWYMYGALLQQGGMHLPYADSARIIVGAWWLVVLVIGTTYCGNLVAYLTFPKMEVAISTLEDLVSRKQSVTWSYAENSYFEAVIKDTQDYTYKTIFQNAHQISNKRYMLEEIKAGRHVYMDWKIKLQYVIKQAFLEDDQCSFSLGSDKFFEEHIALIVAPDTPYLSKINEEIKRLHQVGLIQKWLEDYLPKKDRCWKKQNTLEVNNHTVNLDDMQGSFFVLLIGFCIALLVILVEKVWKRIMTNRKNKTVVNPFAL